MSKIAVIGQRLLKKEDEDILLSNKRSIVKFKSIKNLLYRNDEEPELIIIDIKQSSENDFKKFLAKYKKTPLIVISTDYSFRGFSPWLNQLLTYPLHNPSPRELDFTVKKALREKLVFAEHGELKKRIDCLTSELEFFNEVGKTLTSSLELNDIIATIMKKARKIIKADKWTLILRDEDTGDLVFKKTSVAGSAMKKAKRVRLRLGEGIAGWVAREGIPVVIPDVSTDKRFRADISKGNNVRSKSLMCVPIKSKGNLLGVLEIANKTTNEPFTKDDLDLMMKLVEHAALAIERASLYQKMAELSITDDLTKLFNSRYLDRTLEIEITRSNRHQSSLSLIFMDIDHFKHINDNHGHLVGSKLLVEMGQLLIKSLRTIDIVARYGGDEFVIVLPQTAPSSAIQIAERIRRSVEHNIFLKKDGHALKLTASFGVASYPESAKTKEDLLRLADEAMYRVKYHTRNGVYAIV